MKRITLPRFDVGKTVILNEGEFVARWVACPKCQDGRILLSYGGCDLEGENVEPPVYEQCEFCNGTGHVAAPVEEML